MSRKRYPPEYRARLVELVRAGRTPSELAKEFEPTAKSIADWVRQAERDSGQRQDGLTTDERSSGPRVSSFRGLEVPDRGLVRSEG